MAAAIGAPSGSRFANTNRPTTAAAPTAAIAIQKAEAYPNLLASNPAETELVPTNMS